MGRCVSGGDPAVLTGRSRKNISSPVTLAPPSRLSAKVAVLYIAGMSDFRPLSPDYSVAPQIALEDVAAAKAAGFALVINNRPDGEEVSAPQGGDIASACAAERKSTRLKSSP